MASPPLFSPPTATELAENQGSGIVAANLVVAILATISVGLRFLSRRVQKTVFGIDDWLILAALVCTHLLTLHLNKRARLTKLLHSPLDGVCVLVH